MSQQLHVMTRQPCSLADAMAEARAQLGDTVYALLYKPNACILGVVDRDCQVTDSSGNVSLDQVFEARVFSAAAELRWLKDPGGAGEGRAVLVSGDPLTVLDGWQSSATDLVGAIEQTYLLWGKWEEAAGLPEGWSRLSTAQVGRLDVPVGNVNAEERVVLKAVEYLATTKHGNVIVVDERLTGMEVAQAWET